MLGTPFGTPAPATQTPGFSFGGNNTDNKPAFGKSIDLLILENLVSFKTCITQDIFRNDSVVWSTQSKSNGVQCYLDTNFFLIIF